MSPVKGEPQGPILPRHTRHFCKRLFIRLKSVTKVHASKNKQKKHLNSTNPFNPIFNHYIILISTLYKVEKILVSRISSYQNGSCTRRFCIDNNKEIQGRKWESAYQRAAGNGCASESEWTDFDSPQLSFSPIYSPFVFPMFPFSACTLYSTRTIFYLNI